MNRSTPVRILMIEDSRSDTRLVELMLRGSGACGFELESVATLRDGLARLAGSAYDIVLLDLNLPDSQGLETCHKIMTAHPQVPVILMTGESDAEIAVKALREGAQDYLVKGQVDANLLTRAVLYAIERKQMEQRLRIADRMASVGSIAANVAHEINNPLTYVINLLDLIRDESEKLGVSDSLEPLLDSADEGLGRVVRIARDLRTFARVSEASPVVVNVRELVDSSVQMVRDQILSKSHLVLDYQDELVVLAAPDRLVQVFVNLLVNAAQAVSMRPKDENQIVISLSADLEQGRARVEVIDNGPGIRVEDQTRIFQPFFTTKPAGVGTGLGLSICYQIIENLGGSLRFESAPGRTAFVVDLPLAEASRLSPEDDQNSDKTYPDDEPLAAASQVSGDAGARAVPQAKILFIDDEPVIGEVMSRGLEGEHIVHSVTSGADALELIQSGNEYDLIFCDLMMPEMSGPEVHGELARLRPGVQNKMVFITGGAYSDASREFLARTENRWIEKPFTVRTIRQLLRELLREGTDPIAEIVAIPRSASGPAGDCSPESL